MYDGSCICYAAIRRCQPTHGDPAPWPTHSTPENQSRYPSCRWLFSSKAEHSFHERRLQAVHLPTYMHTYTMNNAMSCIKHHSAIHLHNVHTHTHTRARAHARTHARTVWDWFAALRRDVSRRLQNSWDVGRVAYTKGVHQWRGLYSRQPLNHLTSDKAVWFMEGQFGSVASEHQWLYCPQKTGPSIFMIIYDNFSTSIEVDL